MLRITIGFLMFALSFVPIALIPQPDESEVGTDREVAGSTLSAVDRPYQRQTNE